MIRLPALTSLVRPLGRIALTLLLPLSLGAGRASAAPSPSACLADWSIDGLFDSIGTTHLLQAGIIGGAIALFIMFRARDK
jgi:hypothetical protein